MGGLNSNPEDLDLVTKDLKFGNIHVSNSYLQHNAVRVSELITPIGQRINVCTVNIDSELYLHLKFVDSDRVDLVGLNLDSWDWMDLTTSM